MHQRIHFVYDVKNRINPILALITTLEYQQVTLLGVVSMQINELTVGFCPPVGYSKTAVHDLSLQAVLVGFVHLTMMLNLPLIVNRFHR